MSLLRFASALLLLAPLAASMACAAGTSAPDTTGTSTSSADAAADGAVEAQGPLLGGDAQAPKTGTDCERDLAVGKLTISNAACFVNQHVENKSTKLTFLCAGGKARADFDGHVFVGTVTNGNVIALEDVEPFVFNNCDWISTEEISGDLSTGKLTYTYSEKPKTSCPDSPCTASGLLDVEAGEIVVVR